MPEIVGVQHRKPFSNQVIGSYSQYDHAVQADAIVAEKEGDSITLFFRQTGKPDQGVGLRLPADSVGIVGHLLLAVAEGNLSKLEGVLPPTGTGH